MIAQTGNEMKNKFTKKADKITIDIADATWIANRLSDFASWIGVTPYKAKKLAMMARKIHKLCDMAELGGNCTHRVVSNNERRT